MSVAGDEPTAGVNVSECPKTVVTLARISSQDDRTAARTKRLVVDIWEHSRERNKRLGETRAKGLVSPRFCPIYEWLRHWPSSDIGLHVPFALRGASLGVTPPLKATVP
jgi:hypothetical protein